MTKGKHTVVVGNKISLEGSHGKFVCAEDNGNAVANRDGPGPWEQLIIETQQPNAPLRFNSKIAFRGYHGKYLCAEDNGNAVANRDGPGPWETFVVVNPSDENDTSYVQKGDKVSFRSYHGKYLCAEDNGNLVANRDGPGPWEQFVIDVHGHDEDKFALKSGQVRSRKKIALEGFHGKFVCAEDNGNAVANRDGPGPWEQLKVYYEGIPKFKGALKFNSKVNFKGFHGKFLCAEDNGNAVANRDGPGPWETFVIVDPSNPDNCGDVLDGAKVAFRSYHGKYLCAEDNGNLVANRDGPGPWEQFVIHLK